MGTRFSAHPGRPWGPPSLLYNRVFPGSRGGRGVGLTPHPQLMPKVLEKSRAMPLFTLRACVAYRKGWEPTCRIILISMLYTTNVGMWSRFIEGCPKSKCNDFSFKCLLDSPEVTSYVLQSMTLGKLHGGSNGLSTDRSSIGIHFP